MSASTAVRTAEPGTPTVFGRAAAAELLRLRTVRTTWWCLLAAAVTIVGIGATAAFDMSEGSDGILADQPVTIAGQFGVLPGQFALLALAVLAVTQEYASGAIGPTLQWTPRRGVLLAARVTVAVVVATVGGVLLAGAANVAAWLIAPDLTLAAADVADSLSRVAAVLLAGGVLAVGVGLLLRSTAAGLATVFLLQLVLPFLMQSFNVGWLADLAEWLPGTGAVRTLLREPDSLSAGGALTLLASWAAVAVAAGGWRLLRRDAG